MDVHNLIFSSSSSDEDTPRAKKVYRKRRFEEDDRNFRKLYRFSPENIDFLVDNFMPAYYETRGGALPNKTKMKIFLRYIGDPGFQVIILLLFIIFVQLPYLFFVRFFG